MITYSIIQKSELEGTHRLDAEYYQPEYLRVQKLLAESKPVLLKNVASIVTGPAYSSGEMGQDFDLPLARIGDVVNKTDVEDWLRISKKEFDRFGGKRIKNLDILLSMTGDPPDVGKCNLITIKENETFAFNQRVAKLTPRINAQYLFAYLSTEIARLQPERNALGIRQRNLGINDLRNTLVFVPTSNIQDAISNLVRDYLSERYNSKSLYSQAENLLLEELGFKDFKSEENLFSIVNLSDIKSAHRMDAEYFQPKYEKIISLIRANGGITLDKVIENVPARFSPKLDEVYRYVELANINTSIGIIDGFSEVLGKEAPSRAKRVLKTDDVIVSSVEGSLGKVALVEKEHEGYLASTGFFQLRSKEIVPEALLVLAKSPVFQMQLEKMCAGTILTAVPKESISKILVPAISRLTQQKIADLVKKSHEARKKSKELLEEAKRKVEEMIENIK